MKHPNNFDGKAFKDRYGVTPEVRGGNIRNAPEDASQADIDTMVIDPASVTEAEVRALWDTYRAAETDAIDGLGPIGAARVVAWAADGDEDAQEVLDWVDDLYDECRAKEEQIRNGEAVDKKPSNPKKPKKFKDLKNKHGK